MGRTSIVSAAIAALVLSGAAAPPPSMNDILAHSPDGDWRAIDAANTLVMALPHGRVTIELAPSFAPDTIANIKTLVRAHYFDGSFIVRAQENYVVQWARMDRRPIGTAKKTIPAEFDRAAAGVQFRALPDPDTYARETGFSSGFPAARDPANGRIWLAHCYGMVGVGRDVAADSGNGSEIYAVIGQSPRTLDRNITLVGRVVLGIERLSVVPRGPGAMGFYDKPSDFVPIRSVRLASDVPEGERLRLEALRTDSATFRAVVESRANRREEWFKYPVGSIGVCNVPLPVRVKEG